MRHFFAAATAALCCTVGTFANFMTVKVYQPDGSYILKDVPATRLADGTMVPTAQLAVQAAPPPPTQVVVVSAPAVVVTQPVVVSCPPPPPCQPVATRVDAVVTVGPVVLSYSEYNYPSRRYYGYRYGPSRPVYCAPRERVVYRKHIGPKHRNGC